MEKLSATKFLAFVQSKPADEVYNALKGRECALGQFLKAEYPDRQFDAGFDYAIEIENGVKIVGFEVPQVDSWATQPMMDLILGDRQEGEWTFGKLAQRLLAASNFQQAIEAEKADA